MNLKTTNYLLNSSMRGRKLEKYNIQEKIREVSAIQFGIMSPEEIQRRSVVEVQYPEMFETSSSSQPKIGGLMDPRLGPTNPQAECHTCGKRMETCPGHFGHIDLVRPVYHPGFIDTVLKVVRCVCHVCGRLLVYPSDIPETATSVHDMQDIIKTKRKKYSVCGTIQTTKGNEDDEDFAEWQQQGCQAAQYRYKKENMQIQYFLSKDDELHELTAQAALAIMQKITDEDATRLGFKSLSRCRPEWLILTVLPVPPPTVRPSLLMDNKRGEDDLTFKLADIIKANNNIFKHEQKGTPPNRLSGLIGLLQFHVATYINNDFPNWGIAQQRSHRPIKGIIQRFNTKSGRLRGHLMGKRGDFTARTVIGGDPNVSIQELVMPEAIARILTFPERVNDYNREWLYGLIQNGPNEYPGARMVVKSDGTKIDLRYCTTVIELSAGDVVERHLQDGDIVIFNRQPSLHKMSMMGHRIKVMSNSTFRFNLATTTPYNADYDGDEMNVHVPQSYLSRSEVEQIMMVSTQIISPKNSTPVIGIIQDALLGAALMSSKSTFFTKGEVMQFCGLLKDWNGEMPDPTILKPQLMWTGKQIFGLLISKTLDYRKKSNINKDHPKMIDNIMEDSMVIIVKGELMTGVLDKKSLGVSGGSLIHTIFNDYGPEKVTHFIDQIQWLCNHHLLHRGFSIGIGDCILEKDSYREHIKTQVGDAIKEVYKLMESEEQTEGKKLEERINKILNGATNTLGKYVQNHISKQNNLITMVNAGSKGNHLNISQIMALVGQQNLAGKRIPMSYFLRTLPHFDIGDEGPKARGFVKSSYYDGLSPLELFFHTVGGREGLVDTAIKTADTGYTMRRLVKSMEDVRVTYDRTVRNAQSEIIQFLYGEDNMDSCKLELQALHVKLSDSDRFADEQLEEQFLKVQHTMPFIDREKFEEIVEKEWDQLQEHADYLENVFYKNKEKRLIHSPIHWDRLIKRIKNQRDIHMDAEGEHGEDLFNCIYIVTQIDILIQRIKPVPLFEIMLRKHAYSHRLIYDLEFTIADFHRFIRTIEDTCRRAQVQPGEVVGTVAAQSIGEPAQQMTLNTFHFSGISSRNVTLGVPRLTEIINVSKNPKHPSISIYFPDEHSDKLQVKRFKERLAYTILGSLLEVDGDDCQNNVVSSVSDEFEMEPYMEDTYLIQFSHEELQTMKNQMIRLVFDMVLLEEKGLTTAAIAHHINDLFQGDIRCVYSDQNAPKALIHVRIMDSSDGLTEEDMLLFLQEIYKNVQQMPLCGIFGIDKVFMLRDMLNFNNWILETEGSNYKEILTLPYVDAGRTISNSPYEVNQVLGIEAARQCVIDEIRAVMERYGIAVQYRHLALLSDVMTHHGYLMAISRHGINRIDAGPLTKATFEEMADMLLEAAVNAKVDDLDGVSARIILGLQAYSGTGSFGLFYPSGKETSTHEMYQQQLEKIKESLRKRKLEEKLPQHAGNTLSQEVDGRQTQRPRPISPAYGNQSYRPISPAYSQAPPTPPTPNRRHPSPLQRTEPSKKSKKTDIFGWL